MPAPLALQTQYVYPLARFEQVEGLPVCWAAMMSASVSPVPRARQTL